MKQVDLEILNASDGALKKLQDLDLKTQLKETTFYDAYLKFEENPSKRKNSQNNQILKQK